jgi:hypothetical protein
MAGRDKSKNIDESNRRRLTPCDKGWFITGFRDDMIIATPRSAAPTTSAIPLQRKAISVIGTYPLF